MTPRILSLAGEVNTFTKPRASPTNGYSPAHKIEMAPFGKVALAKVTLQGSPLVIHLVQVK